jgi:hypothetical protein
MIRELRRAPWWAKAILAVVGLFAGLAIVGAAIGEDEGDKPKRTLAAKTSVAPTSAPNGEDESTHPSTPAPPTSSPPTLTSVPPTAIPPPQALAFSGVGQFVTDKFSPPSAASRLRLTHNGGSNFVVWGYADDDQQELLVNTIGAYSGSRPLFGATRWFLEIDADGAWTATIEAIAPEPAAATGITGTGDAVSGFFEPSDTGPAPVEVLHTGSSNFIVWLHCGGGSELVQNEIGPVSGSTVVDFQEGPCIWDVRSEGSWSIALR